MKKLLFLLMLSLVACVESFSQSLNLGDMLAAPNINHFKLKLKEMRQLEILRAQCSIQLKFEMLPISCFEVIQIEKTKHILSEKQFLKTKTWLTENCVERASQTPQIIREDASLDPLPPNCRQIVMKKMNDRAYRDVTMNPELLFKRRL